MNEYDILFSCEFSCEVDLNMSSVIEHIGIFGAFLEGFISFFSPCVLPLLPLYFGYLSGSLANEKQSRKKSVIFTIMFLVGMFTALLLLNLSITWISGFFKGAGIWFMRIGGLLIVVLGVIQLGLLRLPFLERTLPLSWALRLVSHGRRVSGLR